MKFKFLLFFLFLCSLSLPAQQPPKREFRGAWIHTVGQGQYKNMNEAQMKAYFTDMLNQLQQAGINAVIFQVRPQADAFYISELEPWSRYMTGTQGVAPTPLWDPLSFMIEECHNRNMELHAWLNPYRVTSSENDKLAASHIYNQHPEWFVKYGKQIYFDPGLPESRKFISDVVQDLLKRYDLDALHMDDYFYPYPIAGQQFPDDRSFNLYGQAMGFGPNERDDWRRQNVNILIKNIHEDIAKIKPWVRFGISPFGIYRNKANTPDGSGSETNGLQNYDNLYADVLLWTRNGWVDYMLPQLYWEIGHKAACSETLIYWWNQNTNDRHMYIGQDIKRSIEHKDINPNNSQLNRKMQLSRYLDNISGNCFWPGYQLLTNYGGIADDLHNNYHQYPALIPAYDFIDAKAPREISKLKAQWTPYGYLLTWNKRKEKDEMQKQIYFCVYKFEENEPVNLDDATKLVTTTRDTFYKLPYTNGAKKYTYVVTAVDRMHNESEKGSAKSVKL